ncbi:MAG: NBR1-Ig-like domain-containing protein [Anaerolineales bacterium]|nr:NBR1-Ig-like domain-containing protein [Anaerolineales bacterium]MDW8162711.1 NBR1-Ig-like domain-containing protein [Anaerolineales bacterium]
MKTQKERQRWIGMLVAILLTSLACNLFAPPVTPQPEAIYTSVAQTLEAQLTQTAFANLVGSLTPPAATLPPAEVSPTLTEAPPTAVPSPTLVPPTPTNTRVCDLARFIRDVTVPDGTRFLPNQTFTKTWRLQNIGTCTWSGYSLVFDSGDAMGGSASVPIGTVNPGQEVDLSVNLTAPGSEGKYRGYWRIRNASGVLLPVVGGYQGKSFYVEIRVVLPTPTAVVSSGFDLYSRAPEAQWVSCGSPCAGGTVLSFGGSDADPNGFVVYRGGYRLEDGSSPAKVLETHPMWVDNGMISGLYPPYTVVAGDRLRARLGFLAKPDGTCGVGNVQFQINYKEAGTLHPLGSWTDSCDGNLINIDLDLTPLAGKTVQFALVVLANGPSAQDWAVWVNPRIEP